MDFSTTRIQRVLGFRKHGDDWGFLLSRVVRKNSYSNYFDEQASRPCNLLRIKELRTSPDNPSESKLDDSDAKIQNLTRN